MIRQQGNDPFQRLDFDTEWELPFTLHTTPPLTQNLRNSRAIWDAMAVIRPDLHLFDFTGPEGEAITYIAPAAHEGGEATGAAVRTLLHELINTQGITPGDILLITCRADRASKWRDWREAWRDEIPLRALTQLRQTKEEERHRFVKFSTIRASKGLESNVVILVELDGIDHATGAALPTLRRRDKLMYVAISRARHRLFVLGPPTALAPLVPPT
ncbi:MAG: ATP-binding domain-containing protein [Ktedonobacteraceae bacterium]|nr:ATP-binding domain-containing protein [Ktedonobacteraceae bacterium]MBA3825818.1 ATP-binding domain-containing protein [Ktedonobacterales bacterium]